LRDEYERETAQSRSYFARTGPVLVASRRAPKPIRIGRYGLRTLDQTTVGGTAAPRGENDRNSSLGDGPARSRADPCSPRSRPQPIGWSHVTDEIRPTTQLLGGIIGVGEISDCLVYRTAEAFTADCGRHLNDPSWFREPALFGFVFVQLRPLPFQKVSGNVRFFRVGPG
jgi:hypothetical protein